VHTNIGGFNGFLLTWFAPSNDVFQVQETPTLVPTAWMTFTNIITDAAATPTNGVFMFFDNGSEYPFGPMRFYRLLLLGSSSGSLVLSNQPNFTATVSQPFAVTNVATDSNPLASFTYALAGFPVPSPLPAINSTNGVITWTPGAVGGSAFKFTTVVTDNNSPSLSATDAFTIFVLPAPALQTATVTATNVTLSWAAPTNDLFQVQWATNLAPVVWRPFPQTITSASGLFTFTDTNTPQGDKFFRLLWLPLP
jgi:hypothetical protein